LKRFFVDKIIPADGLLSITGKEARHIRNVKRPDIYVMLGRDVDSYR